MLKIKDIVQATGGSLLSQGKASRMTGVSIDSRSMKKGQLFIAIKGEHYDGHRFITSAVHRGAQCVILSNRRFAPKGDVCVICVKDTRRALGQLASFWRSRFYIPVIAITGSVGKTTTKEMIASVLRRRYRVLKNFATQNNEIGVSLTLLRLRSRHQVVVLELGTNHFGEIRRLTQISQPTVAVMLNIGESHLEFLKTPEGVLKEKSSLLRFMNNSGTVFFNGDDRYLHRIPSGESRHRFIKYTIDRNSPLKAYDIRIIKNRCLQFKLKGKTFLLKTPVMHNAYNALAAVSCGRFLKVPIGEIKKALEVFVFPNGRQTLSRKGPYRVIDDSYNSNPVSLKSAIHTLDNMKMRGRKILVCGDMLELGKQSEKLHKMIGRLLAKSQIDLVLTTGRKTRVIPKIVNQGTRKRRAYHCHALPDLNKHLKDYLVPGDVILVKGSRRLRLERVIDFLQKQNGK